MMDDLFLGDLHFLPLSPSLSLLQDDSIFDDYLIKPIEEFDLMNEEVSTKVVEKQEVSTKSKEEVLLKPVEVDLNSFKEEVSTKPKEEVSSKTIEVVSKSLKEEVLTKPKEHEKVVENSKSKENSKKPKKIKPIRKKKEGNYGETVGLSLLPIDPSLKLKPLPCPFDAFSFDGQFGLTVLSMHTNKSNVQTLCRFNHCPNDRVKDLIGEAGFKEPNESFLYPSFCSAARKANQKAVNGWSFFYVLVVQGFTTYRVPLKQFKGPLGPGFTQQLQYTKQEINYMCEMAIRSFADLKPNEDTVGRRKPDVIPKFLKDMLRVLPTQIIPEPKEPVKREKYLLLPVLPNFHPTFVHFS